jgi:hypothetical protein
MRLIAFDSFSNANHIRYVFRGSTLVNLLLVIALVSEPEKITAGNDHQLLNINTSLTCFSLFEKQLNYISANPPYKLYI